MDPRTARALAVSDLIEQHPVVQSASIVPLAEGTAHVQLRYTTVSRETCSTRTFSQTFAVDAKGSKTYEGPLEPLSEDVRLSSTSPDGRWTVHFRVADVKGDEGGSGARLKTKRVLEIVDKNSGPVEEIDVSGTHSDFLAGAYWGQPTWLGSNANVMVYVAALHPPHHEAETKHGVYEITIDLNSACVKSARRISSADRSARLPYITGIGASAKLFYLSTRLGYQDGSCASLHRHDLPLEVALQDSSSVLVDTVQIPDERTGFPGLFHNGLLPMCHLSQRKHSNDVFLLVGSPCASRQVMAIVDSRTGDVHLAHSNEVTSYTPLAADGQSRVVAIRSSPIQAPEILIGCMSEGSEPEIEWKDLKTWSYTFKDGKHFINANRLYTTIVTSTGQYDSEAIIVSATPLRSHERLPNKVYDVALVGLSDGEAPVKAETPAPLVIAPHGGPNGHFAASWNVNRCLSFVAAGFTVALLNYPGSTGLGQHSIERLSKACGDLDVQACAAIHERLVELGIGSSANGKSFYVGGSHAGLLGAHLAARHPQLFDAVDLRNPVIDLPSNFMTSDIPDWNMGQFNLKYPYDMPPSFIPDEETYMAMKKASPSYHVQKLFAEKDKPCLPPTQLQLGEKDLRVPPSQGLAWYHALKGHGEDVTLLRYPGNNHILSEIWTTPMTLEATIDFFVKYSRF